MKVVLQNKQTKEFFAKGNLWVSDINQAIFFENSVDAEQYCRAENLSDVHILIKTDTGNSVVLPCS